MSKASEIRESSKKLLEQIEKAKGALEKQKQELLVKSSALEKKFEEEKKAQEKLEQEQARAEYEAQRAREELMELEREKVTEQKQEENAAAEENATVPETGKAETEANPETKQEETKQELAEKASEDKGFRKPNNEYQNTDRRRDDGQRPFNRDAQRPYNRDGQRDGQRPYNRDGQQRPFNRDAQRDGQRSYNRDGQRDGQQRPFNRDGQRDGQQRPFNRDGQRDGQQRPFNRDGQQSRTPRVADAVLPQVEKERVSNYDPNKKNYRKNHDDQQPKAVSRKDSGKRMQNISGDDDEFVRIRKPKKDKKEQKKAIEPIVIESAVMTTENIAIKDLSEKLGKPAADIVKKLFMMGTMATVNQEIDYETAFMVASEYGIELEQKLTKTFEDTLIDVSDDGDKNGEGYVTRPPVVTIMGHVDHGKTSLLDAIRHANVTASEAGGITQHIGAYQVEINGKKITFIDTPGHEAFTSMRARGAQSTDIAVLVVAADDGVMPQTIEAIHHAKAANVPIIVAINKMDKPAADPERVKTELTQHEIVPEDWGGDTMIVPVSAYTKQGIDDLLESILLVAEVEDYKANPDVMAKGTIIEARLDKGRGPVASVLVQNGTLHIGDTIVAGTVFGRVRAMMNDKGEKLNAAPPSTPVEVLGFNDVPEAGDQLYATEDDRLSRQVAEERKDKIKVAQATVKAKASLDDLFAQIQEGEMKQLNLIIKADVQGSVEAVKQALEKLSNDEVKVSAIHGAVGAITSSDVTLAQASNAIIIGFNVRPDSTARTMAEHEKIDMRMYRIIYDAIEDVEKAMKGMLAPEFKEALIGHAEVRQTFKVPGHGTVAGSYVTDGKISRSCKLRLLRDNIVIHEGEVDSLRRFKDDVREVATGYECGIGIQGYNDIKEGDVIEAFIMEEIAR